MSLSSLTSRGETPSITDSKPSIHLRFLSLAGRVMVTVASLEGIDRAFACYQSRDSSVGIATRLPRIDSRQEQEIFIFSLASRRALEPI
jgi:hypothetical protein